MLLHVLLLEKMWDYVLTLSNWTPQLLCFFVIHVYVPSWFICLSAINVSILDLCLSKKLHLYKMIIQKIADVAITTFNGHLWYLCEELFRFHC